jgi:2-oxoglutarate dehydrogenase E2 component (dihydrolipoamide succinyltransferase)
MAKIDLVMPKMGESIMEATILKWVKNVGDTVTEDETILEIATDKVDSEIPSPVDGKIVEVLFNEDDVVEVGKVIARISTDASAEVTEVVETPKPQAAEKVSVQTEASKPAAMPTQTAQVVAPSSSNGTTTRFYSPLVKSIAKQENIGTAELESIQGSGSGGRVTKKDIMHYIKNRTAPSTNGNGTSTTTSASTTAISNGKSATSHPSSQGANVEIVEMDRMRKMIADHMVMSKHTSPHVTSFVEADVTNIVNWRNSIKKDFQQKYGEKITYTPIFMEAVVKALRDYPMVNVSVDGNNIIVKKDLNIGMATALPTGNLIVPVIKNADYLSLQGLTKSVNDLATRARNNKLKPEDIQGGTFTVTNVGTFGNVMGTPIINQPQAAILAVGAIRKKPAVLETEHGDVIAIRQMMFLSLSYDHRVVDGFLGGSFLRKVADYLEAWDSNREI